VSSNNLEALFFLRRGWGLGSGWPSGSKSQLEWSKAITFGLGRTSRIVVCFLQLNININTLLVTSNEGIESAAPTRLSLYFSSWSSFLFLGFTPDYKKTLVLLNRVCLWNKPGLALPLSWLLWSVCVCVFEYPPDVYRFADNAEGWTL
jgi:hypothetical protein